MAFVEANLGARLTVDQLLEYTWHLSRAQRLRSGHLGASTAVLVVLVPVARGQEADRVIAAAFGTPGLHGYGLPPGAGDVQVVRLTWDAVAAALRGADLSTSSAQDVEQFASLVSALEGLEIAPFTEQELANGWERRREDYAHVVDRTTAALSHPSRLSPMGTDASFQDRRYVAPEPNGTELAVGLRDPVTSQVSRPFWMRYHAHTPGVEDVRTRLAQSAFASEVSHNHGHVWLPLSPATDVGSVAVVDDLVEQVLVRDQAARGSSALREAATHRLPAQRAVPSPSGAVDLDWHGRSVSPDMLLYQVLCGRTREELLGEFRAKQGDLDHLCAYGLIVDYQGDYRLTAAGARFRAGSHDYDGGGDLDLADVSARR